MSVTIVTAYLKSESGDGYLFVYDQVSGVDEFVELVEKDLGRELAYVYDVEVGALYSQVDAGEWARALYKRIDEMGDDE